MLEGVEEILSSVKSVLGDGNHRGIHKKKRWCGNCSLPPTKRVPQTCKTPQVSSWMDQWAMKLRISAEHTTACRWWAAAVGRGGGRGEEGNGLATGADVAL